MGNDNPLEWVLVTPVPELSKGEEKKEEVKQKEEPRKEEGAVKQKEDPVQKFLHSLNEKKITVKKEEKLWDQHVFLLSNGEVHGIGEGHIGGNTLSNGRVTPLFKNMLHIEAGKFGTPSWTVIDKTGEMFIHASWNDLVGPMGPSGPLKIWAKLDKEGNLVCD
jgi:hypothetical protein